MSDAEVIVNAFMAEFDAEHPEAARLASYFSEDAIFHNVAMEPIEGIQAIATTLESNSQIRSLGRELLNSASTGNVVLNERVDRFVVGGVTVELPVVGVFEIRDGKIHRLREYFDLASLQEQMRHAGIPPT